MRVYIPGTVADLPHAVSGVWEPTLAYAVTPALLDLVESDDADEVAEVARDIAALASVQDAGSRLRVVVVAELARAEVEPAPDTHPAAVKVSGRVPSSAIACAFVDEADAAPDVAAWLAGDEEALERLESRDLLWYDASEVAHLTV